MRNQGGGIGISIVTTVLARRAQAHQNVLVAHMTPYDLPYQQHLHAVQAGLVGQSGTVQATHQALGLSYSALVQQSTLLAYIDNFRWLALVSLLCVVAVFFLRKAQAHAPVLTH